MKIPKGPKDSDPRSSFLKRIARDPDDPADDALEDTATRHEVMRWLLNKYTGADLSITSETAAELEAKGIPTLGLPVTKIEEGNDVVLGCAFWAQHAFPDDRMGLCDKCGATICYRPHAALARHKICMDCLPKVVVEMEAKEAAEKAAAEKAAQDDTSKAP